MVKGTKNEKMLLAGDVGGTKTFMGLFSLSSGTLELVRSASYENKNFGGFDAVVSEFLERGGPVAVEAASFGIASPVVGGRGTLTNLGWTIDSSGLAARFGIQKVGLVNDLVATAWGTVVLSEEDFYTLQAGVQRPGNSAVIASGTGLGEAAIFREGSTFLPSSSEGGHADFAPRNSVEIELLQHLMRQWGHASYERVLSGPGIVNIYDLFRAKRGGAESKHLLERFEKEGAAKVISEEGLSGGDDNCVDALELFISIYGAEAGNLALRTLAVGGVYVGGGIAPKILPAIKKGSFMKAFRDKGRFEGLLSEVPVKVILNEKTALFGAAVCASRLTRRGLETAVTNVSGSGVRASA